MSEKGLEEEDEGVKKGDGIDRSVGRNGRLPSIPLLLLWFEIEDESILSGVFEERIISGKNENGLVKLGEGLEMEWKLGVRGVQAAELFEEALECMGMVNEDSEWFEKGGNDKGKERGGWLKDNWDSDSSKDGKGRLWLWDTLHEWAGSKDKALERKFEAEFEEFELAVEERGASSKDIQLGGGVKALRRLSLEASTRKWGVVEEEVKCWEGRVKGVKKL